MIVTPVYGTRALKIKSGKQRLLIISDLHLGLTAELAKQGIELPSQIPPTKDRILKLLKKEHPDRLILLGDVKHNIPVTSWQEWKELPDFFSELSDMVQIEILPGNHDGDIEGLVPKDVIIHDSKGILVNNDKIGLMHGHTWPNPRLLGAEIIISGHNHPTIEFKDNLGARITEPSWVKTSIDIKKIPDKIKEGKDISNLELIMVPAFNNLVGGSPINHNMPDKLIGPIFKAGAVRLNEAEIYLLDGTFLGKLKDLKKNWKS